MNTTIWNLQSVIFALCVTVSGDARTRSSGRSSRKILKRSARGVSSSRVAFSFDTDQTNSANGLKGDIARIASSAPASGIGADRRSADRRRASSASRRDRAASDGSARQRSRSLAPGRQRIEPGGSRRRHQNSARIRDRVAAGPWRAVRHQAADRGAGQRHRPRHDRLLRVVPHRQDGAIGAHGRKRRPARSRQSCRTPSDTATALGFGVSIARALTNEFEIVGELNGRLTPFEKSFRPASRAAACSALPAATPTRCCDSTSACSPASPTRPELRHIGRRDVRDHR